MLELFNKNQNRVKKVGIIIFLVYIFCLCCGIATNTGFDTAPDEEMKYDVCTYIAENMKLPHGGDESIRDEIWGISYAFTPILSYMISAIFMRITMIFTQNSFYIFVAARMVSVICFIVYALICIKISKKLFKGIYAGLFVALVTMLPQMVYLGSYLNNDSLALMSIAIIIYSWILGLESNWSWKSCNILAIGLGICALSYYNAYGYILCSIFIYIISCILKKVNVKEFFKKGLAIAGIALLIGGWWFVRSYIMYDGDFLGLNVSREYGELYAQEPYKPSNRGTPANNGQTLQYMLNNLQWIETTKESFIGRFGYMNVVMDTNIYETYEMFFKISLIGLVFGIVLSVIIKIRKKEEKQELDVIGKNKKENILFNVIMIICIIIPIALSIYYSYFNDFQPQGRYIMPIIIPFMYFITTGVKNIFDFVIRNKKIKNIVLSLIIFIWTLMPLYISVTYIIKSLNVNQVI